MAVINPVMNFKPAEAKWDIKKPENYPEGDREAEKTCSKFLGRVAKDVDFKFEESAFNSGVGDQEAFFDHVCNSQDKTIQVITSVGVIIKALLDRAKLIPGLIHSNNMLWRRGELLRRLLEHYGNLTAKLEEEMRLLLNQLAYMAYQVHTLMNALNLQYDTSTGKLKDNKGAEVTDERKDLLGIDDRMKDLLQILGSIASGELYGQKLLLESHPRFSLKFNNATLPSEDEQNEIRKELSRLLSETMTQLGGSTVSPVSPEDIEKFTRFKEGSLIVLVQLDDEYVAKSGITTDQRKILQMAMFQIAFTTPDTTKYPRLDELYKREMPQLPDFEIPGSVPIPDNAPEEWKKALQLDFGLDMSKFSASKALPSKKGGEEGDAGGGGAGISEEEARAKLPTSSLGPGGLEIEGVASTDAKVAATYKAITTTNPEVEPIVTLEAFKKSGVYSDETTPFAGAVAVRKAKRGSARRRSAKRGSARRRGSAKRGAAAHSAYGSNFYVDFVALAFFLKGLGIDIGALKPFTETDVLQAANEDDRSKMIVSFPTEVKEKVPLITRIAKAAVPVDGGDAAPKDAGPDRSVVAGADAVELVAEVDKKTEMLEKIRKMAASSEVKEFIRVRPYNDKDTRATELQLGTIGETYDRSPDSKVVQGQLGTLVDYKGSCLAFTKLFEKSTDDMFFDKFKRFIPAGKVPGKEKWFSTVNGGVFFEPTSYADKDRSDDGKGVKVVKTDMLSIRKEVSANIKYGWVKKDGSVTTNDDPDKIRIAPLTPKADSLKEFKSQLASVPAFKNLFKLWSTDINSRNIEIEKLLPLTTDKLKHDALVDAQKALSKPTEEEFLNEYYKNRTLSESINAEFVDTIWPVLQIYFGLRLPDNSRSYDTKNIVLFFYGASGSGKTFSAEAILKKCFEEIRGHEDEFQLKIVSDYNNDLFDYYSTLSNLKRRKNDALREQTSLLDKSVNIGAKLLRKQMFEEASERAKFLGWKSAADGGTPPLVFWEGNPNKEVKLSTINLARLGTYNPDIEGYTPPSDNIDDIKTLNGVKGVSIKYDKTIPKNEAEFKLFQKDFERRVVGFRSVTDTGLNPESSRSHLLYIVQRLTKNKQPMNPTERGAQFILADFAGTEDLNYLMTDEAWKIWKEWATDQKLKKDEIEGNCLVAGNPVTKDWACLQISDLATAKSTSSDTVKKQKADFRNALVQGWLAIKIKTLVAKEISENPAPPSDIKAEQARLTEVWKKNLSMPCTKENSDGSIEYLSREKFDSDYKGEFLKAKKDGWELNSNRFAFRDEDIVLKGAVVLGNNSIICNMVLAMHAESKHINDSLKEISILVAAQRQAIEKNPEGKADVASLKLKKKMVTDILATAVTAGSAAVTIGAMNPRRANDWETYKTMVNITSMEAACKAK